MTAISQHTCGSCNSSFRASQMSVYGQGRYDPTRTTTLRNQFAAQMGKRFRSLRGAIRRAIVDQDCFGLMGGNNNLRFFQAGTYQLGIPAQRAFDFQLSGQKVDGFMGWLREQQEVSILEMEQVGSAVREPWTNTYIHSSYQQGIKRARSELVKAGYDVPSLEDTGGIHASLNQPFHVDRVGLMYSRTFNDLKGITEVMDGQISRVLAQAMADGKHPAEMARLLTRTISGPVGGLGITDTLGRFIPAERRAKLLARTEVIRSHHVATIQEYENWAVEGVTVVAEWSTAGDNRVCADCAMLEFQEFTLKEIEGMIPRHTQCRCMALPKDITDKTRQQQERAEAKKATERTRQKVEEKGAFRGSMRFPKGKSIEEMKTFLDNKFKIICSGDTTPDRLYNFGDAIGNQLYARYPKLQQRAAEIADKAGFSVDFVKSEFVAEQKGFGLYARYNPHVQNIRPAKIEISANRYMNVSEELTLGTGKHNVGVDVKSIIRHEYGHHIHYRFMDVMEEMEWDMISDLIDTTTMKEGISHYAATNSKELFAESFAAYTSPFYGKEGYKRLPLEIEEFMKTLIGDPR